MQQIASLRSQQLCALILPAHVPQSVLLSRVQAATHPPDEVAPCPTRLLFCCHFCICGRGADGILLHHIASNADQHA